MDEVLGSLLFLCPEMGAPDESGFNPQIPSSSTSIQRLISLHQRLRVKDGPGAELDGAAILSGIGRC